MSDQVGKVLILENSHNLNEMDFTLSFLWNLS